MGDSVVIVSTDTAAGKVTNSGAIQGGDTLAITATNIENLGGTLRATNIDLVAAEDVVHRGGTVRAENRLKVIAGRDLGPNHHLRNTQWRGATAGFKPNHGTTSGHI